MVYKKYDEYGETPALQKLPLAAGTEPALQTLPYTGGTPQLTQLNNKPEGFTGSATGVGANNNSQQSIIDQMNANSIAWWEAGTQEEKDALHAKNQALSAQLGGDINYDPTKGTWTGIAGLTDSAGNLVSEGEPGFTFLQEKPTFSLDDYEKPIFDSQGYGETWDDLINKALNREAFSYNYETDPLYQQYASQYTREGNRAMNDTLAAAASGAGGMNSYALSAAQQANNYYMAQLGDKIPELYQMAYDMYLKDIDIQRDDINMVGDRYNTLYNEYRDDRGDYQWDVNFGYGAYRDDVGDYNDEYDRSYTSYWDEKKWDRDVANEERDYGREDSDRAYEIAMDLLEKGTMPNAAQLEAADLTEEQAKAIFAANGFGTPAASGNGGSSSGDGYVGGYGAPEGWDEEKIRQFQRDNGLVDDGIWGPKTKAAYEAQNNDNNDPFGLMGSEPDAKPTETEDEPVEDAKVVNRHSDSWVNIPGRGRMTWQEVESYVNSGKIKEELTPNGYSYTWVG